MSPAGTSVSDPTWRKSSLTKAWQKRITSPGLWPFRIEITSALAAAHGEGGQCILEGLFEAEKFQDRQVDRGVEADAALVGADGRGVLDPVATIDMDVAVVVTTHDTRNMMTRSGSISRSSSPLLGILRVLRDVGPQAFDHFCCGLEKFRLPRVAGRYLFEESFDVLYRMNRLPARLIEGG